MSRQVIGLTLRTFAPPAGKGPCVILLGELAELVGIPPVGAGALRRLPKRLREAVTRGPGASGPAVPVRWVADLAGYDLTEIPFALQPIWQAARDYRSAEKRSVVAEDLRGNGSAGTA